MKVNAALKLWNDVSHRKIVELSTAKRYGIPHTVMSIFSLATNSVLATLRWDVGVPETT